MSDTAVQLSAEQLEAMMKWQVHAATWVVSQALAINTVAEREDLSLGSDDILCAAVELYKVARNEEARRRQPCDS